MILSKERDLRFITIRRDGTLTDSGHQLLGLQAARAQSTFCTSSSRCGSRAWARGGIKNV